MRKVTVVVVVTTIATVVAATVLAAQLKKQKERRWRRVERIIRTFARECATPIPKLWHIANDLVSNMRNGLSQDLPSNLTMLPSYIYPLPKGDENGLYYGLNLRGDDFLMLRGRLEGRTQPLSDLHREEVSIPSSLMTSTSSKELFEYVALQLARFVSEDRQATTNVLGVTVSYPVHQANASAIKWKSFSADDTVEKELLNEINQALENHAVDLRVLALVDDTTGDLAGGRYYNKDSVAAITLGMTTNASYIEQLQQVSKWHGQSPESEEMVISIGWGNLRSPHLPITEFDTSLDAESSNPGSQIFEKLISGMYLGEIVRKVLLKMAQEAALFGDDVPQKLKTPYLLRSPDMAAMHQDTSEDHEVVDEKLKEIFGITDTTPMVRKVVADVCDIVAERGARLAGAGIVGIIKKMGRMSHNRSVVTVEGGLYEHYRIFRNYVHSCVWEMLGNFLSEHVILEPAHGGSGASTIFLAAKQSHHSHSS